MAKILVVEDDKHVLTVICDLLSSENYLVETAENGLDAEQLLNMSRFDIIILDWNVPGITGVELLRRFRRNGGSTPVLMLTGREALNDKELGFTTGADDYLTKPFHLKELALRINALLRRTPKLTGDVLQNGDLMLDRARYMAERNGEKLELLPKEFDLLEFFMRHPDQVFSLEQLLAHVWASDAEASTQAVRQCIKRLRKRVGDEDGTIIRSVYGAGYKMDKKPIE